MLLKEKEKKERKKRQKVGFSFVQLCSQAQEYPTTVREADSLTALHRCLKTPPVLSMTVHHVFFLPLFIFYSPPPHTHTPFSAIMHYKTGHHHHPNNWRESSMCSHVSTHVHTVHVKCTSVVLSTISMAAELQSNFGNFSDGVYNCHVWKIIP